MHEILNGCNPRGDARLLRDLGIETPAPPIEWQLLRAGLAQARSGPPRLKLVPAPATEDCGEWGEGAEGGALAPPAAAPCA